MSEIIEGFEPSNKIKLLPCPFCGGEFQINVGGMIYIPKCKKCGCTLAGCRTEEEAIEEVNTRKPMERIIERLEGIVVQRVAWFGKKDEICIGVDKAIEMVKEEGGIE